MSALLYKKWIPVQYETVEDISHRKQIKGTGIWEE